MLEVECIEISISCLGFKIPPLGLRENMGLLNTKNISTAVPCTVETTLSG